jgi:replicative DNA helicase
MLNGASTQNFAPQMPPAHNIEAEQALLGALLINNDAFFRVEGRIDAQHFYDPLHAEIFDAIAQEVRAGRRADAVTLKERFSDRDVTEYLSVPQYLGRLIIGAVSTAFATDYAERIRDLATRRMLMVIAQEALEEAATDYSITAAQLVERAERRLFDVGEHGHRKGFMPLSEALSDAIETASAAYQREDGIAGIPTGIRSIDRQVGGLMPSNLIVMAGRPAMGKTALGLNIAVNAARAGYPVGFFSLEMSADELATRIMSQDTGISVTAIRRGSIDDGEFRQLVTASQSIQSDPLFIDETGGATIDQITSRARRLVRTKGVRLIVVDYLQIMRGMGRSRYDSITDISNGLKTLAKELEVPVIALSQLSRANEGRDDKRPQLADLRESGAIEQDADMVWFVHREEYYLNRQRPDPSEHEKYNDWETEMNKVRGKADIIIAKNRHGPCDTVRLIFDGARTLFRDGGEQ